MKKRLFESLVLVVNLMIEWNSKDSTSGAKRFHLNFLFVMFGCKFDYACMSRVVVVITVVVVNVIKLIFQCSLELM